MRAVSFTILLCLGLSGAADASEDWLSRAIAQAKPIRLEDWGLRQTVRVGDAEKPAMTIIADHDPRRPMKDRWRIVSVTDSDGADSDAIDANSQIEKDILDYATVVKGLDQPRTLIREEDDTAVYALSNVDADALLGEDLRMEVFDRDGLDAHVTVRKSGPGGPYVEQLVLLLPDGAGDTLLAQLDALDMLMRFRPAAEGLIVPRSFNMMLKGGALVFLNFNVSVDIVYDQFVYYGDAQ